MTGILNGKAALVTGGASGIGRATAVAMAREGARVAVSDRTEESAAATAALINETGGQAIAIGSNVTQETEVEAMVARTVAAFGRIDCAFNNAGIAGRAVGPAGQRTHELSQTAIDGMLAINLTGVFLCLKYEIAQMLTPTPDTRPATIEGWTVRQVYGGTAVLEGPGGVWRATRGDTVPGVGRIDSIVLWGGRWIVATTRGLITTQ